MASAPGRIESGVHPVHAILEQPDTRPMLSQRLCHEMLDVGEIAFLQQLLIHPLNRQLSHQCLIQLSTVSRAGVVTLMLGMVHAFLRFLRSDTHKSRTATREPNEA